MQKTLATWCAMGVMMTAMLAACGSSSGGAEEPGSEEATSGGDLGPYAGAIASTDVDRGKEVFDMMCGDCHPDGEGDVGPSLVAEPHSPARLRQQIREGGSRMRPFSEARLNADDMEAVLAYLASIHAVK